MLYQAAKGLYLNQPRVRISELADRELVDDTSLSMILDAVLLVHYGKTVLTIGINKLREITNEDRCKFVLWVGNKRLIKRRLFDQFIEQAYSI